MTRLVKPLSSRIFLTYLLAVCICKTYGFPSPQYSLLGEAERSKRVMLPVSKFAFLPDKLQLDLGQEGSSEMQPKRGNEVKRHYINGEPSRQAYGLDLGQRMKTQRAIQALLPYLYT